MINYKLDENLRMVIDIYRKSTNHYLWEGRCECHSMSPLSGKPKKKPSSKLPHLDDIPSGKHTKFAIENGPVEIVSCPINSMVALSSSFFV